MCVCVCVYVCVHLRACVYMYMCVCVCVHVCILRYGMAGCVKDDNILLVGGIWQFDANSFIVINIRNGIWMRYRLEVSFACSFLTGKP